MRSGSSTGFFGSFLPRFNDNAPALLVFTTFVWGANAVAARLAVGEVSPMMLTFMRWFICCVALWLSSRREIARHWRSLLPQWRYIVAMGFAGFTAFNALFYAAAHHTTAINIAIIQGTIPVLVLVGSYFFFRHRIRFVQMLGVLLTMAGIVVVASRGDFALLQTLSFNVGDVWMVGACVLYTGYALGLRRRPDVPAMVFFAATAVVACVLSAPLVAMEVAMGDFIVPGFAGVALMLFVGLLPSYVSQVTFLRAVALIGPPRAGLFLNLVPVFGPLLAVVVLGEPLALYHALALALVLGGIYIAERLGTPAPPAPRTLP